MEVDWEFELGGAALVDGVPAGETPVAEAPIIAAHWPGFVDLRRFPERAVQLPEAAELPGLAEALAMLNADASPVWTSKCDVWPIADFADFDADELDAPPGCAAHAMGCYIDLLPRSDQQWQLPAEAAAACRHVCNLLHAVHLRCCRVDLVIRSAVIAPGRVDGTMMDLGITAYLTACGASQAQATAALEVALAAFAHVLCDDSKLQ
jgi:hypothetical protein